MLALSDPHEAYRRSELDARVQGGSASDIVGVCLDQAVFAVQTAIHAHQRGDRVARSAALTRALGAVSALEMGVDQNAPVAGALMHVYGSFRKTILDNVGQFVASDIEQMRADLLDIRAAFGGAQTGQDGSGAA